MDNKIDYIIHNNYKQSHGKCDMCADKGVVFILKCHHVFCFECVYETCKICHVPPASTLCRSIQKGLKAYYL